MILTDHLEDNGIITWEGSRTTLDSERIERSVFSTIQNKWSLLRMSKTTVGSMKF